MFLWRALKAQMSAGVVEHEVDLFAFLSRDFFGHDHAVNVAP